MKESIKGANPYLPLWEHIPDGEPRVFEHEGEKRVYIYGSHDIERDKYCGRNYVVWSAPVDDLTDWKYHGVSYERSMTPFFTLRMLLKRETPIIFMRPRGAAAL